jgi:hypothetical protein
MPQPAKRLGDGLVAVLRGVLVDHRGPSTRMTEAGHQLRETRPVAATNSPADVRQIMGNAGRNTGLITDRQGGRLYASAGTMCSQTQSRIRVVGSRQCAVMLTDAWCSGSTIPN